MAAASHSRQGAAALAKVANLASEIAAQHDTLSLAAALLLLHRDGRSELLGPLLSELAAPAQVLLGSRRASAGWRLTVGWALVERLSLDGRRVLAAAISAQLALPRIRVKIAPASGSLRAVSFQTAARLFEWVVDVGELNEGEGTLRVRLMEADQYQVLVELPGAERLWLERSIMVGVPTLRPRGT
jgi:hypothetical protein